MKIAGEKTSNDVQPSNPSSQPTQTTSTPEQPTNDKPFDDTPFDAGVEADETTDPKKFIEQLTGKLGQSLRKYSGTLNQPDFDLEKFVINSVLSATHTSQMDTEDQNDIIKKVKEAGDKDDENNQDNSQDTEVEPNNNDANQDNDFANDETSGNIPEPSNSNGGELTEINNLFIEPKKNNMFQPNSNDILTGTYLENSQESGIIDKIKDKVLETFKQNNKMKNTTEPIVKPEPTIKPTEEPKTIPSRRNKPFLPMPSVQPDPKAEK